MTDKAAILADLERYMGQYPPMLDSDITTTDLAIKYDISLHTALSRMRQIARDHPEQFDIIQVEKKTKNGRCWVLRKCK